MPKVNTFKGGFGYVGITHHKDVADRIKEHRTNAENPKHTTKLSKFMRKGLVQHYVVFDELNYESAVRLEKEFIAAIPSDKSLNMNAGGGGPKKEGNVYSVYHINKHA